MRAHAVRALLRPAPAGKWRKGGQNEYVCGTGRDTFYIALQILPSFLFQHGGHRLQKLLGRVRLWKKGFHS